MTETQRGEHNIPRQRRDGDGTGGILQGTVTYEELRAQAVALRRQGLSRRQIRDLPKRPPRWKDVPRMQRMETVLTRHYADGDAERRRLTENAQQQVAARLVGGNRGGNTRIRSARGFR